MADTHAFVVGSEDKGLRLDQVIAKRVPGLSRRKARVVIDIGGVFVDQKRVKVAGRIVRVGQSLRVNVGGALSRATQKTGQAARAKDAAQALDFETVHEDDEVVVVCKPAGLLSAPTPESDTGNLVDALMRGASREQIFVVHRLDMATSGLLVFAKTQRANVILSDAFKAHSIERMYLAILAGSPDFEMKSVSEPVGGKSALTHLKVIERYANHALAEARLETGRTHQIRIHCANLGYPVLGDRKYGHPHGALPPQMGLHATRLGFTHPTTSEFLAFTRPLPSDLSTWLESQPK